MLVTSCTTIKKFVTLLYEAHEDYFTDLSKVSDAGNLTKAGIYHFLERSEKTVMVVDCENSNPYKLYATLKNLDQEALLNKISKIILYNDVHAASAWKILNRFTSIPIEHNMIERLKDNKSLVDIRLTTGTCREFFQNHVDSFILVSSDSDYWGLISAMPEVRFFVMVESIKCGPDIKMRSSMQESPIAILMTFAQGIAMKSKSLLFSVRSVNLWIKHSM